jgi:short-subunit dehydrogenase
MPGWFANQTAVITGASSGIGWALAKVLAAEGCKVGLLARRKERLEALAEEIRQAGGTAALAPADVADREQTLEAIRDLAGELGPVDLLVAGAGVGTPTELDPVNSADVEQMFRVNVLGVVYAIEAVLPDMLRRGRGHLAAISSIAAYKGLPRESGYCATKAAVNTYLEGLRLQLRSRHITVTTICPGFVLTPMVEHNQFRMPWLLQPDEAAWRIAKALKRKYKVYNFPWQMALCMRLTKNWAPDWLLHLVMSKYEDKVPYRPILS